MIKHDIFPIQSAKTGKKGHKVTVWERSISEDRTSPKPVLLVWSAGALLTSLLRHFQNDQLNECGDPAP